ncbi:FtsX-like permease family protein [Alphaproteobacteria bacterium]|nr:FtsX-like permease family protein [Alphaproteobacteria bacterium]
MIWRNLILRKIFLKLSISYIFNSKKDKAFSTSTILSSFALILGISILITVMSVMNGFREELVSSLVGVKGDLTIIDINDKSLMDLKKKFPKSNFIKNSEDRVIVSSDNAIEGVLMKTLSYKNFKSIPKLNNNLFEINYTDDDWIFIGVELARILNLKVGQQITLNTTGSNMTILGPILNSEVLTVRGIFNLGMYEFDRYYVYSSDIYFNEISSDSIVDVYFNTQNHSLLLNELKQFNFLSWSEQNSSLSQALMTEKNVMFIILFFIVIISCFTIISNQVFFIKEKFKDIVLLKSMGVEAYIINLIFFINSFIVSFISVVLGTILGILMSINIGKIEKTLSFFLDYNLFNNEIYYLSNLPHSIKYNDITMIIIIALSSVLIASIIPLFRIQRITPNLILR